MQSGALKLLQWYFILFFSRDHVLTMLHLAPIFFWGEAGHFGGDASTPQIPLDGNLAGRYYNDK